MWRSEWLRMVAAHDHRGRGWGAKLVCGAEVAVRVRCGRGARGRLRGAAEGAERRPNELAWASAVTLILYGERRDMAPCHGGQFVPA